MKKKLSLKRLSIDMVKNLLQFIENELEEFHCKKNKSTKPLNTT
ncbi:MAG: hypothetical protein PWP37_1551 [Thermotogota bacterium]|nr:hypothetical protein [Thermotogota bacterium]MDK2865359.1 hypothetical protein [Thermotogota bacterium]